MKMIEHAAEIYYYNNSISEKREEITFICNNGKCSSEDKVLELEGNTPELGIIKIDKNGKVTLKSILMNGYNCKKNNSSYKCEKTNKRRIETDENLIHINDNKLIHVTDYRIYGNSVQNGKPTSTNPVEIENVGDLVTDTTSEHYGKYEIKIKVVGKNLFDNRLPYKDLKTHITNRKQLIEGLNSGQRIFRGINFEGVGNEIVYGQSNTIHVVIPIKNNTTYKFRGGYVKDRAAFLDENFIGLEKKSSPFENKIGAKYIMVYVSNVAHINDGRQSWTTEDVLNNLQVEIGEQATEYEPYKEEIYSIYLDEPLRCVKNTCDYIDFNEKKIVRKIRKHVFNGEESWSGGNLETKGWGGTNTVGLYQYINTNGGNIFGKYSPSEKGVSINNYFVNSMYGVYDKDVEGAKLEKNIYYGMRINRSVLEEYGSDNSSISLNQTAFASFLKDKYEKGNPVYVLYELEKEIEEEIQLPEIYLNEDISNITIDTKIKPSKIELEYYK